jgi:hypothetical protein
MDTKRTQIVNHLITYYGIGGNFGENQTWKQSLISMGFDFYDHKCPRSKLVRPLKAES